jgi:hypothetical protein
MKKKQQQGQWTEKDQAKAAERGQGAEIGAAHDGERASAESKTEFAGSKPKAPSQKK